MAAIAQQTSISRLQDLASSTTLSFSSTPTAGRTVVALGSVYRFGDYSTILSSISDNQGNTYTLQQTEVGGDDNTFAFLAYATNIASSGTFTVTANFTTADYNRISWMLLELSDVTSSSLDVLVTGTSSASSSTSTSSSGTLAQANEILIGTFGSLANSGVAAPSGWTSLAVYSRNANGDSWQPAVCIAYKNVNATTAQTYTVSHDYITTGGAAIMAAFKDSANTSVKYKFQLDTGTFTSADTGITALVWRGNPTAVYATEYTGLSGDANAGDLYITSGLPAGLTIGTTVNAILYNSTDTSGLITGTVVAA